MNDSGPMESDLSAEHEFAESDAPPRAKGPSLTAVRSSYPPSAEGDLADEVARLAGALSDSERRNEEALSAIRDAIYAVKDRSGSGGDDAAQHRLSTVETSLTKLGGRVEDMADTIAALSGDLEASRVKHGMSDDLSFDVEAIEGAIAALEQSQSEIIDQVRELSARNHGAAIPEEIEARLAQAEKTSTNVAGKLGHALKIIAERIDDLDARVNEFNSTADYLGPVDHEYAPPPVAAPISHQDAEPEYEDEPDDPSVAPYIARAEREMKAKARGGDVFDRIARAASQEYEQVPLSERTPRAPLKDDRKVGTKRWTPSKAAKKRMEEIAAAREAGERLNAEAEAEQAEAASPKATKAPAMTEEPVVVKTRRRPAEVEEENTFETAFEAEMAAETDEHPDIDIPDREDDEGHSGLRTVPGALGRRRNRARKSTLDPTLEQAFSDEDENSIGGLRNRMRRNAAEEPEPAPVGLLKKPKALIEEKLGAVSDDGTDDDAPKRGFFARLLGRKPKPVAKETEPDAAEDEIDDAALQAVFDDDSMDPMSSDADDTGWDDIEDEPKTNWLRIFLLFVLMIVAGAAYYGWQAGLIGM